MRAIDRAKIDGFARTGSPAAPLADRRSAAGPREVAGLAHGRAAAWRAASCLAASLAATAVLALPLPAAAQSANGPCRVTATTAVATELDCGAGLAIVVERSADYTITDGNGDGAADAMTLRKGAALATLDRGARRSFQIQTPRAIAAVRGTAWAVDAGAEATAVFVVEGTVAVRSTAGGDGVALRAGEGVDVESTTTTLTVRRWPEPRVRALMARFGR